MQHYSLSGVSPLCIMALMKLQDIMDTLKQVAPPELAEEWDNTGLLINPLKPRDVKQVLLTIDLTEAVALEAIDQEIDVIVSYHPILFRPAQRFDSSDAYDRTVMHLIQNNIAVYSPHTALDAVKGGVNDWLAEGVGAGAVSILQPVPNSNAGQGRLVTLNEPVELEMLAQRIKTFLGLKQLRQAKASTDTPIKTVALCAGAGTDAFKGVQADVYLTGEMSHHHILAATLNGSHVLLCEHTNTERGFLGVLADTLQKAWGNGVDISISEMDSDPIKFN